MNKTALDKKSARLKFLLDKVLADFPAVNRIKNDPIQFPRWFFDKNRPSEEIEVVALISAMLAYGSAKQFTKKLDEIFQKCNYNFLRLIIDDKCKSIVWPGYRLSTASEISILCQAIGNVVDKQKSIKNVFMKGYQANKKTLEGLANLRNTLMEEVNLIVSPVPRGIKHLLPNPVSGGCAKRWHMFLRWMVRGDDKVDMGLWKDVSPSQLIIPLDRHISKISRNIGLTARKADDLKTAIDITNKLSLLEPDDPVKYDFSLCHLGIAGECTHGKDLTLCNSCILNESCTFGKSLNK